MIINHNMSSIFAARQENLNTQALKSSMEKISSGQKINRAGDDAANLAVSEKMRSQIRGLNQANKNVQNGVSFIQVTEGYLQETTDILQRIRELAVQSSNGLYSSEDRLQIQVEVSQLVAEVDRIASSAQFNGLNMLTGRYADNEAGEKMTFQVGANVDQSISVNIAAATAEALGLKGEDQNGGIGNLVSVEDVESSNMTLATIDNALKIVNSQRANLGAIQNRMETAAKGIAIAAENLTSAESIIRDEDMASAMVEYTRNQILQNSSIAMISQANSQSQNVLSLLK
jgi:flagellin